LLYFVQLSSFVRFHVRHFSCLCVCRKAEELTWAGAMYVCSLAAFVKVPT
jgi:hypothetical protein